MNLFGKTAFAAALSLSCAVSYPTAGQEATTPEDRAVDTEEIVILGRIGGLRRELQLAEDAALSIFNEINSGDGSDIHCRTETSTGSRMAQRRCESNDSREQRAAAGQAMLQGLRGESGIPESGVPGSMYAAEQQNGQRLLAREMRRLAVTDERMSQAMQRVSEAQSSLSRELGSRGDHTMSRPIAAADYQGLPDTALRMFEVLVGKEAWAHGLKARSFTIANVTGEIRKVSLDCPNGRKQLDYEPDVDWTLPEGWQTSCALIVEAKRDTAFMLFEFE
jgi:hypothetical protein